MISFDFEYYRPSSIEEAVSLFKNLESQNKEPVYYEEEQKLSACPE